MYKVSTFDSLESLPPDVVERSSYPQQPELFECLDWFKCLHGTVLGKERQLQFYVARDDNDRPAGLFACGAALGSKDLASFTNYYALDYRPVYLGPEAPSDDVRKALYDSFIAHIAATRPRWQHATFESLRSDRPDTQLLLTSLRARGFLAVASPKYENWFLDSRGLQFETYFANRSSQLRNTITRKEKKIKKAHRFDIKIYTQNDAALSVAIEEWVRIYNSSWKQAEPYPEFMPALIRMCADLGMLRLGVAYLDDKAAAAQLWINSNQRAIIYKLAYDEAFAELSVGAVLSRELFRNAIDVDRVLEIDYGIGSESYKREWMSGVRNMEVITAYNLRSPAGALRAGGKVVKAALGRLRSAKPKPTLK